MGRAFSKREQRVIALVGLVALTICWVYTAFIIGPLIRDASTLGQQVRSAREELTALEQAIANEMGLRDQHRQVEQAVLSYRQVLPPDTELPATIEFLSDLASQSNLKIQAIFPQRREEAAETAPSEAPSLPVVYHEVPIQIDALVGYHQLGTFLNLIESAPRPMRLSSLRISSNPREPRWHTVKLLLEAYFATAAPASTTPASP